MMKPGHPAVCLLFGMHEFCCCCGWWRARDGGSERIGRRPSRTRPSGAGRARACGRQRASRRGHRRGWYLDELNASSRQTTGTTRAVRVARRRVTIRQLVTPGRYELVTRAFRVRVRWFGLDTASVMSRHGRAVGMTGLYSRCDAYHAREWSGRRRVVSGQQVRSSPTWTLPLRFVREKRFRSRVSLLEKSADRSIPAGRV